MSDLRGEYEKIKHAIDESIKEVVDSVAFGPALILSLFWKRTTKAGIFSGMATGTIITIVWTLWFKEMTGIYELIPGFFGAFLVIVLVSLTSGSVKKS